MWKTVWVKQLLFLGTYLEEVTCGINENIQLTK